MKCYVCDCEGMSHLPDCHLFIAAGRPDEEGGPNAQRKTRGLPEAAVHEEKAEEDQEGEVDGR